MTEGKEIGLVTTAIRAHGNILFTADHTPDMFC